MKRSGKWLLWALAVLLLTALLSGTAFAQNFYGKGNVLIAVDMAQYAENEDVYYPEGNMGTLVWGEDAPTGEGTRAAFEPKAWTPQEAVSPEPAPDYALETVYEVGQKLVYLYWRREDPDYAGFAWLPAQLLPAEAFTPEGQPRFPIQPYCVDVMDGVTVYYLPFETVGDEVFCCADFLELECAAVSAHCTIWQYAGNAWSTRTGFDIDEYMGAVGLSDAEIALLAGNLDAACEAEARVYGDPRREDMLGDRDGKAACVLLDLTHVYERQAFFSANQTLFHAFDCLILSSAMLPGRAASSSYAAADYLMSAAYHELNHYILDGCLEHGDQNMWLGEVFADDAIQVVEPDNLSLLLSNLSAIRFEFSEMQRLPGLLYAGYTGYPRYSRGCYILGEQFPLYIERRMTGTASGAFWTPYFAALTQTKDFSDEALDAWLRETTGEGLEAWIAQCMAAVLVGAEDGPYCMGDAEITALYRVDPWQFFRDAEDYGKELGPMGGNAADGQAALEILLNQYGLSAMQGGGTTYAFRNDAVENIAITGADERWYFFAVEMELPDLEKPIEISAAEELAKIGSDPAYPLGGRYILTDDIDLGGEARPWEPIGTYNLPFFGELDGNGHTVSGLYVSGSDDDKGLFAFARRATIRDLTVRGSVSGRDCCGGLVGLAQYSAMENCVSYVTVNGGMYCGGVAGMAEKCALDGCVSFAAIDGAENCCGGVAGYCVSSRFKDCVSDSAVTGHEFCGGVAGLLGKDCVLEHCVNTGAVEGYKHCGGVAGFLGRDCVLERCVNTGAVTGVRSVGGITSEITGGCVVRDCRGAGAVSGDQYVGALADLIHDSAVVEYCSGEGRGLPLINENRGALRFFRDVPDGAWYADAVNQAANLCLVSGVWDAFFAPEKTLSRAQAAQLLCNLCGAETAAGSGDWFAPAVAWLTESGIYDGQSASFEPNEPVARETLALWLCRCAALLGFDVSARAEIFAFSDAPEISEEAREAMEWAVAVGLIDGVAEDRLAPGGSATRAQAAALLMRFCAICFA